MANDQIVIYQNPDGNTAVEAVLQDDSVWLILNSIAELFESDKSIISKHIRNVYAEGELERGATVAKNAIVQKE